MMASHASSQRNGKSTASGIVETRNDARRVIPESRRPDGSIRKERKIKPGFVPVEDVERFVPSRVRQARQDERLQAASAIDKEARTARASKADESKSKDALPSDNKVSRHELVKERQKSVRDQCTTDAKGSLDAIPAQPTKADARTTKKNAQQDVPDSWDESDNDSSNTAEQSIDREDNDVKTLDSIATDIEKLTLGKDKDDKDPR